MILAVLAGGTALADLPVQRGGEAVLPAGALRRRLQGNGWYNFRHPDDPVGMLMEN